MLKKLANKKPAFKPTQLATLRDIRNTPYLHVANSQMTDDELLTYASKFYQISMIKVECREDI